jgi:cation diffusion facilitator family transporter
VQFDGTLPADFPGLVPLVGAPGAKESGVSASGGTKAIIAALLANAGIALAKFVGYLVTGSSSMLAEAVHSVADTSNQGLLLLGGKRAQRAATAEHPFGYGRDRYFYSFVVALLLFSLGSVFALYEGIHKLESEEPLTSPLVAVIILVVAIGLEGFSFRTAIAESRPLKGRLSWWGFIRQSKSPELPVVLLEDFGALIGLVLALLGVGLSVLTGNPVFDALGTIAIGVLLGVIAVILIVEMKSLLIGEGASAPVLGRIVGAIEEGGLVQRVIHIRTQYLGPEELLVAAKIALQPCTTIEDVARGIDAAEQRVRSAVPEARLIYLEPDLDRSAVRG